MVKTKKTISNLLLIVIAVLAALCISMYLYCYQITYLEAGDTFTSGNAAMDSMLFSDNKTPIAKKNAEALFNSSKATIATVGNYGFFDNGVLYKEYYSKDYTITVSPILNNSDGAFTITYAVVNSGNSSGSNNVGDIIRLDFIHNGKEVQPTSTSDGNTDKDYSHKVMERLYFDGVNKGDEFVVIFYNYAEMSAVAFPFTIQPDGGVSSY